MRIAVHTDWSRTASLAAREIQKLGVDESALAVPGALNVAMALAPPLARDHRANEFVWARQAGVTLVGDARIDNIDELAEGLDEKAAAPVATLLVAAYQRWGNAFPDRLAGDFAIVLWDEGRQKLLAARDPFGVRPLVYRTTANATWIASGIEQLLGTFDTDPSWTTR